MRNNIILKDIINLDLKKNFFLYGIDKLINQKVFKLPKLSKPQDTSKRAGGEPFEPECPDLTRLYSIIRMRKILTVLEFGSGFSTKVIGEALKKNKLDYSKKYH